MQPMQTGRRAVVPILFLFLAVGCSSDNAVYPVQGKISFEGKPMVGGGSISFIPVGNQSGKTAGGQIAEDGTYKLMTYRPDDGSMPGKFRVVITQVTEKEPEPTQDGQKAAQAAKAVAAADRIPLIYSDDQKSPLHATVEAKSMNEINFELKRTPE